MILLIECIVGCIIFGTIIIISVLKNSVGWINEYPKVIQQRYIDLHPDFQLSKPVGLTIGVIIKKIMACVIFIILLSFMVSLTNVHSFKEGALNCYCIWFVVNAFDTLCLDLGLMVHWKKCRLPGTEDMDEEYKLLNKKSLIDGLYGCLIGIPVSLIVGFIVMYL